MFLVKRMALPLALLMGLLGLSLLPSSTQLSLASHVIADEAPAAAPAAPAAPADPVPDASGANTGGINDITAKVVGKPTLEEVAADAGHTKIALNIVWTLIAGFLVMFMQAGFALVETGFCRAKNSAHTFFMNFAVYFLGMAGFMVCGYALMMGNAGGIASLGGNAVLNGGYTIELFGKPFQLFGTKGFFLGANVYDVSALSLFLFQMVFMDTAVTIPTGALAERWKTTNFIAFSFFMSMFVYPIFGNWVWGGGWLSKLGSNFGLGHGHVDFAGSSVVHMVGGVAALAGCIVLGARIGKFDKNGNAVPMTGHHMPMAILGTMILAFGWFGFNAGSSLAGGDLRIAVAAVNTMLASAGGGLAAMFYMKWKTGKWDPGMTCNGFLAGMVAITAPCAFVTAPVAFWVIGGLSGLFVCWSCSFVENKLKLDDPVGAISVHGVNGAWGVLSLGLFADGSYGDGWNGVAGTVKGLFYGDAGQFKAQLIGTTTCIVWVFVTFFIFFKVCDMIWGIRVPKEVELEGLDIPECGTHGYPEFQLHK